MHLLVSAVIAATLAWVAAVPAAANNAAEPPQELFGDDPYCTQTIDIKQCVLPLVTGQVPEDYTEPAVPAGPYVDHPPLPEGVSPNSDVGTGTEAGIDEAEVTAVAIDADLADRVEAGELSLSQAMAAKPPTVCRSTADGKVRKQADRLGWEVYFSSVATCTDPVTIGGQAYLVTPRGSVEDSGNQVDKIGIRGVSDGFFQERKRYSHATLGVWSFTGRKKWVRWSRTCKVIPDSPYRLTCTSSSGVYR